MNNHDNNVNVSAIDRALAAAKARKAAKESLSDEVPMTRKAEKTKPKLDAEAKMAARLEKEAQKAKKKADRDEARAARRSAKEVLGDKKPSHMKKVERALSKLPVLNEPTQLIFNEATCNLSARDLDALAQHVLHHNRQMATMYAMKTNMLTIGSTVRITAGDPKFVGMVGTVVKSRQLRAKIQVPGIEKLVYIFTGQAEPVEQSVAAAG